MEKIMDKIRKLLEVTQENGASENEAMIAALKAQKLMAEYNIELADLRDNTMIQEIKETMFVGGKGYKWRYTLAGVIATNFCCKYYIYGKEAIVFYGYEKDTKIACEVFTFLFKTGNKLAANYYNKEKKAGKPTAGLLNTYLMGFCQGIKDVLGKQCVALALVTPPAVVESFNEKMQNAKQMRHTIKMNHDNTAYEAGRTEGRNTANARSIEG